MLAGERGFTVGLFTDIASQIIPVKAGHFTNHLNASQKITSYIFIVIFTDRNAEKVTNVCFLQIWKHPLPLPNRKVFVMRKVP